MKSENQAKETCRSFIIEQIFESWDEYRAYYEEACKIFSDGRRKKGVFKKIIRRYFEVEFKSSIKAPRYFYPEDSEAIVLQVPAGGSKTRNRGERRLRLLDEHQHVIGSTELYIKDQIAMRLKIMGVKLKKSDYASYGRGRKF